jgi:hypothetical protein
LRRPQLELRIRRFRDAIFHVKKIMASKLKNPKQRLGKMSAKNFTVKTR